MTQDTKHHNCDVQVWKCMDFRISDADFDQIMTDLGIGPHDTISVAGSGKDLVSSQPGESAYLLKQIRIAYEKHHIKELVFVFHDDCGAYGIADFQEEEAAQRADVEKIRELLSQEFPQLTMQALIIKGTPTGEFSVSHL